MLKAQGMERNVGTKTSFQRLAHMRYVFGISWVYDVQTCVCEVNMRTAVLNSGFKRLCITSAMLVPSQGMFWAWEDPSILLWCLKMQKQDQGKCYHVQSLLCQGMSHGSIVIAHTRPEGPLQTARIRWFWKLFNMNFQQFLVSSLSDWKTWKTLFNHLFPC